MSEETKKTAPAQEAEQPETAPEEKAQQAAPEQEPAAEAADPKDCLLYTSGLPLVGDANGGDIVGIDTALGHHLVHDSILGGPQPHGDLVHPVRGHERGGGQMCIRDRYSASRLSWIIRRPSRTHWMTARCV